MRTVKEDVGAKKKEKVNGRRPRLLLEDAGRNLLAAEKLTH